MHLRGPINVSQLAVYQVPNEALKMSKRSVVPFFSRRGSLEKPGSHVKDADLAQPLGKRTWTTTTGCELTHNDNDPDLHVTHGLLSSVNTTVTVTECKMVPNIPTSILPNTTYIGPPSSCLPTSDVVSTPTDIWYAPKDCPTHFNYARQKLPTVTQKFERHPHIALRSRPARMSDTTPDVDEIKKRAAAWNRVAYYTSASPAQATGFSFMANLGDPRQSGTFD